MDIKVIINDGGNLAEIVDFNYYIFVGMYENKPYNLQQYQERLSNKKHFIFSATVEDKLVGDAISYIDGGNLYLWIMGVDKNFRRQGIAKNLLDKTLQIAQDHNLSKISAKVYDVSPEMKALLLKLGYQLEKVEESKVDSKYNANYYFFKLR